VIVWGVRMYHEEASLEKDMRVLEVLRKTLAQVIKEITPADTTVGIPLEPSTIDSVHMCFDLISVREREIALAIKQRDKALKQHKE